MPSTYSTNLALELIGTGDQAGTWGNTTNTNLGTLIEQAISGYVTQAVSTGTDTTITIPNGATGVARNMYIELTGTGGTNTNLIVPSNKKLYFIFNNSTGAVTVKVSGQTGVSVPQGKKVVLASNGTDVVNGLNYIADFGSNSATITTLSATSATITNLTLTSLVISNLSIASANITTLTSSSATITNLVNTSASITTLTNNPTFSAGTANGVLYLDGSKVATSGSALTFDGTNLGIGTSSPGAKLNVQQTGLGNFTSLLLSRTTGNTLDEQSIVWQQNDLSNLQIAAISGLVDTGTSGSLLFKTSLSSTLTTRMVLDPSGNLGIGTSSPGARLHSVDTIHPAYFAASGTSLYTTYSRSNTTVVGYIGNGTGLIGGSNNDNFAVRAESALMFASGGATERMRLDSSGNLGLGVTPSAWQSSWKMLQVGQAAFGRFSTDYTIVSQNFFSDGANKYIEDGFATMYFQNLGKHVWRTAPNNTSGAGAALTFTDTMTLDASGNLGIGTTSPLDRLDVVSGSSTNRNRVRNSTSDEAFFLFQNSTTGTTTSDGLAVGIDSSENAYLYNYINSPLIFATNATERARITAGGQFLVGTTTASSSAQVKTVLANGAGSYLQITKTDATAGGTLIGTDGLSTRIYTHTGAVGSESYTQVFEVAKDKSVALQGAASESGAGITFPATQSASSNANTLDDYEEGTWQGSFSPSTSGTITINTSDDTGAYTKIGRQVTVTGNFQVTSVASPVGVLVTISGLPFTIGDGTETSQRGSGSVMYYDNSTTTASVKPVDYIEGQTSFRVWFDASTVEANDSFTFTVTYFV